jgi:tetratricopeptide (TPR) repeat protein
VLKGLERHKCNVNTKNFHLNFVNSPHLDGLGTILQIPTTCTDSTGTDTKISSTTRYQCDKRRYGTTQRPCTVLCRTLRTLLGPDHPGTLDTLISLGQVYMELHQTERAEKLMMRAYQECEKTLRTGHRSTLLVMLHLGALYANMDQNSKAEKMYLQALRGFRMIQGSQQTSTLDAAHDLGALYNRMDRLAEAEKMFMMAFQGRAKILGPEHIETLDTIHSLAMIFCRQGKFNEAEKMLLRVPDGHEKILGKYHSSTLPTVWRVGRARVNAEGGNIGRALQAASSGGHDKVVQMLLNEGAELNLQTIVYDSALQAASSDGHERVTQMLLSRRAEIKAQRGSYGNALHAEDRDDETGPTKSSADVIPTLVRRIIQHSLSSSRRSSEGTYTFTYNCIWMVPTLLGSKPSTRKNLSDIVTLTGTAQKAQAASCSEYVSQFWPRAGLFLLETLAQWFQDARISKSTL